MGCMGDGFCCLSWHALHSADASTLLLAMMLYDDGLWHGSLAALEMIQFLESTFKIIQCHVVMLDPQHLSSPKQCERNSLIAAGVCLSVHVD